MAGRQAGAMEGDVIVAVAGQNVRNLSDMYDVSRYVEVTGVVTMDIRRWGQVMTLVLPALQAQPAMIQGANAAGAQPVAWIQGPQGAQFYCPRITGANATAIQPVAWPSQAMPGAQFCCPYHNRVWSQNEVYPQFRCPICNCPLNRVR